MLEAAATGRASRINLVVRRCKPLAAFCTAPLEHKLTALGAHAHSKAVCFGATAVIWLKGPLHDSTLLEKRLYRKD